MAVSALEKIVLDAKDRQILYYLDLDARMSGSKLSKRVGLSKEAVRYRIRRLEERGIIKGYFTVIDVSRLGYMSFRVYLKFQAMSASREKALFTYLQGKPQVGWFVSMQGTWDMVLVFWVRDIYEFEEFWMDFIQRFGAFVETHWISLFSHLVHFDKSFLVCGEHKSIISSLGRRPVEPIDQTDQKLLKYLSENSRYPLIDLEKKTKQNYKVVAYRIKRLEKNGVILCYRAFIDFSKIGYHYYKVFFSLQNINLENLRALEEFVSQIPNTVFIDKMIGGADFEAEFQSLGTEELRKILDSIRFEFPDLIRNFEIVEYYYEHKLTYLPPLPAGTAKDIS